ncbi:MAG: type II toxin-antitoxin system HicB family antitoxin [Geobacteraceae bacterium]|nr:type II toxin-antitoxin system HicB family antitoxin [Geobacteraceae bacterium]
MKDMMKYKKYFGSVHYSDEDRVFYGKIEFVRALVSYEGTDVESLRRAFEEAVDDYLDTCKGQGSEPEKPFKGTFNVRIGPELHLRVALAAAQHGVSLNSFIADVLKRETEVPQVGKDPGVKTGKRTKKELAA